MLRHQARQPIAAILHLTKTRTSRNNPEFACVNVKCHGLLDGGQVGGGECLLERKTDRSHERSDDEDGVDSGGDRRADWMMGWDASRSIIRWRVERRWVIHALVGIVIKGAELMLESDGRELRWLWDLYERVLVVKYSGVG
tara:strand:- start:3525 stop:3947 length:423 start_codon:yes stop_codon:yes gene_type:complete